MVSPPPHWDTHWGNLPLRGGGSLPLPSLSMRGVAPSFQKKNVKRVRWIEEGSSMIHHTRVHRVLLQSTIWGFYGHFFLTSTSKRAHVRSLLIPLPFHSKWSGDCGSLDDLFHRGIHKALTPTHLPGAVVPFFSLYYFFFYLLFWVIFVFLGS